MKKLIPLLGILISSAVQSATYEFDGQRIRLDPYIKTSDKIKSQRVFDFFNETVKDNTELPKVVDLRNIQTPVKNQGNRGSCSFFTANALIESLIKKNQGIDVNLSEEYLIYKVKGIHKFFNFMDGSITGYNLYYAKEGALLERDLPYQPSWFEKGFPCEQYEDKEISFGAPPYCYAHQGPRGDISGKLIKLDGFVSGKVALTTQKAMEILATNKQPLIISLPLHPDFWNSRTGVCTYSKEIEKKCEAKPSLCGNHSVMIVGYDQEKKQFLFKNSWGKKWGDKGYGRLSFDYVDGYVKEAVTAFLSGKVDIPEDYNSSTGRSIDLGSFDVSVKNDGNGPVIVTSFSTKTSNKPDMPTYVSIVLMQYDNSGSREFFKELEDDKSGEKYLKMFYFNPYIFETVQEENSLSFPSSYYNTKSLARSNAYVRVRVWSYSDESSAPFYYKDRHFQVRRSMFAPNELPPTN